MTTEKRDGDQQQCIEANLQGGDDTGKDDDLHRQKVELKCRARSVLSDSQLYIPEIDALLKRLSATIKMPALTGLPTFLRHLNKVQETAEQLVQLLSTTNEPDEDVLRAAARRLDVCAVESSQVCTQWDVLKRCRSLVAVNQAFQGSVMSSRAHKVASEMPQLSSPRQKQMRHRAMKQQAKVKVDVVADGGAEWIDIRTVHVDRLARQMTDAGWGWGEHELGDVVAEDEWHDIPLARQTKRLVAAARANRHEYQIPRLRIILPNIRRDNLDTNILLDQLTSLDPAVQVVVEGRDGVFLSTPSPALEDAIDNLAGNKLDGLTDTLNLDHSVLVDLISDITHMRLESRPWQAESTRIQIQEEKTLHRLMTHILYPVLEGRRLVCTREAAAHFHLVLSTVGTPSERERGRLLVPYGAGGGDDDDDDDDDDDKMQAAAARSRFQQLSVHAMPPGVQIPVDVVDQDWTRDRIANDFASLSLPAVALDVARHCTFTAPKLSVFMYGWASGHVTLTSNKEVKGQIRTLVEAHRRAEDERGPAIRSLDVTRNLLSKSARPRDG